MVMSNGYIKMVDFGLFGKLDRNGEKHDICGTPTYFCPAKLQGKFYNQQTDLWSLGIFLYEMLTKTFLFTGNTRHEIFKKVKLMALRGCTCHPGSIATKTFEIEKINDHNNVNKSNVGCFF